MSDTPRTDNACGWPFGQHGLIESTILSKNAAGPFVHASVARELERAATNWEDVYRVQSARIAELERENGFLLNALERLADDLERLAKRLGDGIESVQKRGAKP